MKRSAYLTGVALLALVACSAEGKTGSGSGTGAEVARAAPTVTPGNRAPAEPLPAPYTLKALKAALLTSAELPSRFEIHRTTAAEPSSPAADAAEVVRPARCAGLRNPDLKAKAETIVATAQLHRPSEGLDLHRMSLAAWSEADAKARMAALRTALDRCWHIEYENPESNGTSRAGFQAEKAPKLGDDTLRYSQRSRTAYLGFTVVRVQGVIAYVRADTIFGASLPDDRRAALTPRPEEKLIRAQVAKIERTLGQGASHAP
ncbi:hypothetical protein ACHBTE_31595 [Streptomyces sp. M41]|uniref:hypothetical protein n=1 Tax=Streptomyces sp. M41 TaxID=3059412 RepID=UPI00374CFFE5